MSAVEPSPANRRKQTLAATTLEVAVAPHVSRRGSQLVEPAAAAFAATNASATELNAVREAHQTASDARDMPDFEHWDAEFHHRVFACCWNDFLKEIHNLMRAIRSQSPCSK
ncbi:MAG: FCD domain-containing protein [Mesorhizobium sp.]|nr:MAG: FCD domain-containing protein [Mesorhizobium sp.]TIO31315.1 MAG: FCD domain-containing protein [Mesorhizobium sp.]TIP12954.1 MAG: FCD domain-containing protein [Mesorhizobium sp.]